MAQAQSRACTPYPETGVAAHDRHPRYRGKDSKISGKTPWIVGWLVGGGTTTLCETAVAPLFAHPVVPRERVAKPKLHDVKRRLTTDEQVELVAAYVAGASSRTVGQQFGVDRKAVIRLAREAGVARNHPRLTPAQVAELAQRYQSGESAPQLGKAFDIGTTTVLRTLRSAGIPIRPRNAPRTLHERLVTT